MSEDQRKDALSDLLLQIQDVDTERGKLLAERAKITQRIAELERRLIITVTNIERLYGVKLDLTVAEYVSGPTDQN